MASKEIRTRPESNDRPGKRIDRAELEIQHSQKQSSVHHEEGATSHTPAAIKTTHAPASEEGAIGREKNSQLHRLPQELLNMILKYLDRVTIACLGLTCKRLYSVHFARNGPASLNEKSRYRISDSYSLKTIVRTMSSIVEEWLGGGYEFCNKFQILVSKGNAWAYENWLPEERGGDDYKKASCRRTKLHRVRGIEHIRIQQEELTEWRLERKVLSRKQRFEEYKRRGTLDKFYRMEELIKEASKVEVINGERRDGMSVSYLVEKW